MNELDDVLAVKGFVKDYLTRFYGKKPVLIDLTKAIKTLHIWDLSVRARIGTVTMALPYTSTDSEESA